MDISMRAEAASRFDLQTLSIVLGDILAEADHLFFIEAAISQLHNCHQVVQSQWARIGIPRDHHALNLLAISVST